ncbi:MAG: fumarylacetoacetate hydrolase family protein [Rhodospirillum sp.]|nr:fumarylacetoacetate hydrolase family protein [Rhodospirillum sp.]MCF8489771.1 fumarylacetoacetate hydrolase family protein [Rhodospirillum sp.]MCF8501264.1 fumarylacetoacetate hydrolase family protein [Rhodospirillum sp.]
MTNYLFAPPEVVTVAIEGSSILFPVNRIFCVGRNYAAHAAEMGVKADKEEPFYFTKAASAIVPSGSTVPYPPETENYHYEMELVAAIGKPIHRATLETALDGVYGYACGLDMTRRDLQLRAREKQRPWDLGKDFEQSAVISPIVPVVDGKHPTTGEIALEVNGETKQKADLSELINSTQEVIVHLSRFYHLMPGDLIYTGTPAGVGAVKPGDVITGHVDAVGTITLTIGEPT